MQIWLSGQPVERRIFGGEKRGGWKQERDKIIKGVKKAQKTNIPGCSVHGIKSSFSPRKTARK